MNREPQMIFDPQNADSVFVQAVELAILNDDFRLRLQRKMQELAETRKPGRREVQPYKIEMVKNTITLIQHFYANQRCQDWKAKVTTTNAIKKAAEILEITEGQAKGWFYK